MMANGIVTLLTDFGYRDIYVGVMKGVMLCLNPDVRVIDITHGIAPQDVDVAALMLDSAAIRFPVGSTHLAVVDPGVGSERRAIALQTPHCYVVAPDNGVLSAVMTRYPNCTAVELPVVDYGVGMPSATFHGRDIFAPVAAHLSRGVSLATLGEAVDDLVRLPTVSPDVTDDTIRGVALFADHFGNISTNIDGSLLAEWAGERRIEIGFADLFLDQLSPFYAAQPVGEPLAIINSFGLLEIAIRDGNAAQAYSFCRGMEIVVVSTPSIRA